MANGATPPLQFGKYQLIERIAVGGMAEIWRAKAFGAAGFEKELVLKRILPQFSADEEFVRMFIDEARLVARLQHANVVQIYDFDSVEGEPGQPYYYIAMEWVDGRDLRHLLKEGIRTKRPIPYGDCLHIAIETLKGLHYAHTRADAGKPLGIVHRDVSPHNILVSYSGDVKISDFGIAKAAARASATSNGMVKGKLAYMSPEQITGQALDRRTDVFSMGIVLYEMLTRTRLFVGASEIEVINKVRDAVVPPPRSRNPEIAADVEQVLLKMLAGDREARFSTAAEAARALSLTSQYQPTDSMALGEYAAQLFPPGQKPAAPSPARAPAAPAAAIAPRPQAAALEASPNRKTDIMGNPPSSSRPPANEPMPLPPPAAAPAGDDGASTMMMEGPPPEVLAAAREMEEEAAAQKPVAAAPVAAKPAAALAAKPAPAAAPAAAKPIAAAAPVAAKPTPTAAPVAAKAVPEPARAVAVAEQSTAIFDADSPENAGIQAQIAAAKASVAKPSATASPMAIAEQNTAIFDSESPENAAIAAKIAAARAAVAAPSAAAPLGAALPEQNTAILDGNNPQVQSAMAQIAAARASAPPPGDPLFTEQKTAILDASNPEMQSALAQVAAKRAAATPPAAGPAPVGGGQRTMALDMSATAAASARSAAQRPAQPPLAPLPAPQPPPSTWQRWVVGVALLIGSCTLTTMVLGVVHTGIVAPPTPAPPPPPRPTGRIKLQTNPQHANILLDGKPYPHFTPASIEGAVGDTARIEVSLEGYKAATQDVVFSASEQSLTVPLDKIDTPAPGAHAANAAEPAHSAKGAAHHEAHHAAPAPAAAAVAPKAAAGGKGSISLFVKPSANVIVDGKSIGATPMPEVQLAVGKHTIELVNDALKKKEKLTVSIHAGENPEIRRNWAN